jgi:hypothetical protein
VRRAERQAVAFVRALLAGGAATPDDKGRFVIADTERRVILPNAQVRDLLAAGVLVGGPEQVRAADGARTWLRRQLLAPGEYAAQHRTLVTAADGAIINLAESPLARLATAAPGEASPFLESHQVEAGERVRRLAERACLQPRTTMSYDAAHTARTKGGNHVADLGDLAADARRALAEIHTILPRDCAGVVLDVCGLLKGLQTVENERGWPRRSAKLVLRIGLDQLARHYGLAAEATGPASRRDRAWLDAGARPQRFE